jgi:hypothetical protein
MTFSISGNEPVEESELTFPVVLPNGDTAYCKTDKAGRIDPREAYGPWLGVGPRARPQPRR